MANIRLVALFALLIFLSLPPTLPSKGLDAIANGKTLSKLFKVFGKMFGAFNKVMDIYNLLQFLENLSKPKDNDDPPPNMEAEPVGFYVDLYVGYDSRPINARMSISSSITYFENYDPPTYSGFHQCCDANLSCTYNCSQNGYDYAAIDIFSFSGGGMLMNNLFRYNAGDKHKNATGFLSLSRNPNSLLWSVREQIFSYKISESAKSKWSLGVAANTTELESTKIVNNTNHPDLYYITLTHISIGSTLYPIDPTTMSSSVILDTVVTATLLETSLYTKVTTELMKLGSLFNDTAHGLELCISGKPNWPNLTLYFSSDSSSSGEAQMVLTRDNYVVKVEKTKTECAAIFETKGASVIGIMAQINRRMVFDLSTSVPRLYFSRYPSSAFFVVPSIIMIFISSLCVLLCFDITV